MRILVSLLALGLASSDAQAPNVQSPAAPAAQVERVDVVDYGIYTADEQSCHRDDHGVLVCQRTDVHHAVTTLTIPAQHGVHFGFHYKIVGTPDGATVRVKGITNFPAVGLSKPGTSEPLRNYQYEDIEQTGQIYFTDYAFDDPWELVPGTWTVEIWVDDRRMAFETFTVVQQ